MAKTSLSDLHVPGNPLLLYNIWDAGSALAIVAAGAKAVATGSMSVAGSQGYPDGEGLPLDRLLETARMIVEAVDVPVSVDFEGGYARDVDTLQEHAKMLAETGAVGLNFEDRIVAGEGLYGVHEQVARIGAVATSGLFVNVRTDLFLLPLMQGDDPNRDDLVDQTIDRAAAYVQAGADGLFVPGLSNPAMIERLCETVTMPVNVMMMEGMPSLSKLADRGVGRISWGPGPWRNAMARLEQEARAIFT